MKFLNKHEIETWCHNNSVVLGGDGLPSLPHLSGRSKKFKIPSDAGQRVALVSRHFAAIAEKTELLIWVTDWGVWPSGERSHIFERFRKSYGENRPLIECPGHLIEPEEIEDGLSVLTISVLFLWDCYVITKGSKQFIYYSHDEVGVTSLHESV